ncbi:MAG: hypothetical protein ACK4S2_07025 [Gemmobacter sp.]|uniref:hypothetical protein n=1 Tax=Gemmobacter sp. TaxID=1898957 RepID=UPI00391AB8D8
MNEGLKTYAIHLRRHTEFGLVQVELYVVLPAGVVITQDHPVTALRRALQDCLDKFIAANKANA